MQEDEEVGKLSAGVPIAVCTFVARSIALTARAAKALELFIRDLVVDASAKAQEKGAKKLSPYHVCVLSRDCGRVRLRASPPDRR